ncbi:MAG: bifunctional metallophosphatase/5'-nucleotidase [Magnetococcales bacterium]|nr:bifunctional metallophosphatase/5'-nucleotidase [Magnetococcales bacterium]
MKTVSKVCVILTLLLTGLVLFSGPVRADIVPPSVMQINTQQGTLRPMAPSQRPMTIEPLSAVATGELPTPASKLQMPPSGKKLTILHFCDVDEVLTPDKDGHTSGDMARFKTLVDQVRSQDPQALLLLSGDFLFPSMIANNGKYMIRLLNAIGLDYAMPGNHEFDFGVQILNQRVAESTFPWLASNVLPSRSPLPGWRPYALREVNGIKVGIFSILTQETVELALGGKWVHIGSPLEVSRMMVQRLKGMGAEVIIAMTHMDFADERLIAEQVPEIDMILGGHDHIIAKQVINNTLVVESGSDLKVLGRIDFAPEMAKKDIPVRFFKMDPNLPQDPTILKIMAKYQQEVDVGVAQKIGSTLAPLNATRMANRSQETNLGSLITDAMRGLGSADVALINSGAIRSDQLYGPGDLYAEDVNRILPFNNVVVKLAMTGQMLKLALEHGVSQLERFKGRFLQVSGVAIKVERERPQGQRLLSVMVNGMPLDPNRTYTVVTNRYMAEGGDGFSMLTKAQRLTDPNQRVLLAEVVAKFIQNSKVIQPSVQGRIVIQ